MHPVLYDIVDSVEYVYSYSCQRFITRSLDEEFDVKRIELKNLKRGDIPAGSRIISRLKLKTVSPNVAVLAEKLPQDRVLFVYEQDTWINFMTGHPLRESYSVIRDFLHPTFIVGSSDFWANRVRELGIKCVFAQPWVPPDFCVDLHKPWKEKKFDVVFCGSLYPTREMFFRDLKARDINVKVFSMLDTKTYFQVLNDSRIAIRTEPTRGSYAFGDITSVNGLWFRDVEAASQGCFSMREHDSEYDAQNLSLVPSIKTFYNSQDAADKIKFYLNECADQDLVIKSSIDYVKAPFEHNTQTSYYGCWKSVAKAVRNMS